MNWLEDITQRQQACQSFTIGTTPSILVEEDIPHLIEAIRYAVRKLELIGGMCGNPDAAEGCRLILKEAKRARDSLLQGLGDE